MIGRLKNQAIWLADRDRLFRLTRAFQLSRQEKFLEIFYTAKNNQKKWHKLDIYTSTEGLELDGHW